MILKGSEEEKLLEAIEIKNTKKVKSILKRSTKNKKILELNEKDFLGYYPLLRAIREKNDEIVQLLIDYANQHQIILKLNEKDKLGSYPLLRAIFYNNIESVQLLIDYALQHQIILEYDKKKIEDKPRIKNLLQNYENRKKVIK